LSNDVNVNDGVWRHLVWTIDSLGNFLVYLNGVLHSSFPAVFYPRNILRTLNYLGKDNLGVNRYTNGALDEFYMFPKVLTITQVQTLYQQGIDSLKFLDLRTIHLRFAFWFGVI